MQEKKNQILVCQVLQKVHLLAEKIIVLSPGFVPFSTGNTEALKALEDWEKQQKQKSSLILQGLSSHQLPTFQTFLIAILLGFSPQVAVLYTKLDCLQIQKPLDLFFIKSKPQFCAKRSHVGLELLLPQDQSTIFTWCFSGRN